MPVPLRPLRTLRVLLTVTATAVVLSSCAFSFTTAGTDTDDAVGFTDLQSATLQIEAVGTFVSPTDGRYEAAGRGSGFLISADGYALTNNHVVTGAGTVKVWRAGNHENTLTAKIIGTSECLDLAVIKIEGTDLPYIGDRGRDIVTADEVYAAGYPLGNPTFTMTKGIVSKADTPADTAWASHEHVIEHDARIRAGNSGGPLVDPDGRLVGINYAGDEQHDTNLAIHRDEIRRTVEDLRHGRNVAGIGINGQALTTDTGQGLGVWVNSLASGSPADKAGITPGDLITSMEGVSLGTDGTLADYCDVLATHGQDATLSVEVYRPSTDTWLRGQINGTALTATTTVSTHAGAPAGTNTPASSPAASTGGFTTVTDNSRVVRVDVPTAWSQIDGTEFVDDRGNLYYGVEASSDLATYKQGWGAVGASVLASDEAVTNSTAEDLLDWATRTLPGSGCTSRGRMDYHDNAHTGRFEAWENCGPERAKYIIVAARANTGRYLALIAVQANTEADITAADRVVNSFTITL